MTKETTSRFLRLCATAEQELFGLFDGARTPDPDDLAGWEFRAFAPGDAGVAPLVRLHRQGFYRLKQVRGTGVGGYVIPCHPGSPGDPWVDRLRGPASWKTGWFVVDHPRPGRFARALSLDFSRGGLVRPPNPLSYLRGHLVQPSGDPDLLLGALQARAGNQVRHLGFCVLHRDRRTLVGLR